MTSLRVGFLEGMTFPVIFAFSQDMLPVNLVEKFPHANHPVGWCYLGSFYDSDVSHNSDWYASKSAVVVCFLLVSQDAPWVVPVVSHLLPFFEWPSIIVIRSPKIPGDNRTVALFGESLEAMPKERRPGKLSEAGGGPETRYWRIMAEEMENQH